MTKTKIYIKPKYKYLFKKNDKNITSSLADLKMNVYFFYTFT